MAKRAAHRPRLDFNPKTVEGWGAIGASNGEMASMMECSERTISRRMNDTDEFCLAYQKGLTRLKGSLRRKQIALANRGDRTMLIWLGKQLLGQKDTSHHDVAVGGVVKVQVFLPEKGAA